jgi:ABC-type dipeptide/oligopeptide/nickel transport system permease subunit
MATVAAPALRPAAAARPAHPGLRRLLRHRAAIAGAAIVLGVVLVAVFAPILAPYALDDQDLAASLAPPAWMDEGTREHLLGTDALGRDILSRLIFGARVSVAIAGVSVILAAAFGIALGLLSGYFGKVLDATIMRIADVQLSFPYLLLAIAIMGLLRPSLANLVIVLVIRSWVVYTRLIRASTMSLKRREFVVSARAVGAGDWRILFRHVAPNVIASAIVVSSFQLAELIILEASLSFLGLGVQPPTPSWGNMLGDGRAYMTTAWWLATLPGCCIILTVLGVNLLGDALRDYLDPRFRSI